IATNAGRSVGTGNRKEDAEPQVHVDERRSDVNAVVDGGNRSNRRAPDSRERADDDALHVQVSPDTVAAVAQESADVMSTEGDLLDDDQKQWNDRDPHQRIAPHPGRREHEGAYERRIPE